MGGHGLLSFKKQQNIVRERCAARLPALSFLKTIGTVSDLKIRLVFMYGALKRYDLMHMTDFRDVIAIVLAEVRQFESNCSSKTATLSVNSRLSS
jgi:hypothetical protein